MAFVQQTYAAIQNFLDKRVVLQMDDTLFLDRPDVAALLAFMARHNMTKTTKNMEFHHLTKRTRPPYIALAGAGWLVADPTHFPVPNGSGVWFEPNGTYFFNGVQMMVSAVAPGAGANPDVVTASPWPSTQTLPVADVAAGAELVMSYPLYGEKADAPQGNYQDTEDNFNYCEQMMRGITLTELMTKTEAYGPNVRQMEHRLALQAWKTDIEMRLILGKRYKDESQKDDPDVGVVWSTGGVDEILTEKVLDFGAQAFSQDTLLAQVPDFLEFCEPSDWIFYVPASFLMELQLSAMDKLWYDTKDDSFGYAVRKWTTSFGDWPLVHAKMLDHFPVPTAYLLNKNELKKVTFQGTDSMLGAPRLYMNAQLPSQPNKIHDYFRGIMGFQRGWAQRSCKVFNWAAA